MSVPSAALSPAARRRLVEVARQAIGDQLAGGRPGEPPAEEAAPGTLGEELARRSGAFVTLLRRADGELRGCVGIPEPYYPLQQAVMRAAVAAAVYDGRFEPVTADELPGVSLHISVLGPLARIDPEEVTVGVHGLVIRSAGKSGLLLPQVAVEQEWGREQFLDATCRKAGLPPGTWRQPWCEILAFTATVFGEDG